MLYKIIVLSLFLCSSAWATVPVERYPSGTPVQVCQPSDTNSNCGGTTSLTIGTTPIALGTNTYLEYNNNGVLGEIPQSTFANAALSNLSGVAINASLLPGATNSISLGNSSYTWKTADIVDGNGNSFLTGAPASAGGNSNVAVGYLALSADTSGASNNVAIGGYSNYQNTSGSSNTSVGQGSLQSNLTGTSNVAIGRQSLASSTGTYETAIGEESLKNLTGPTYNTGLGYQAGNVIADGSTPNVISSTSTYLGAITKAKADADTNETVIGYNAIGNGNNTVTIGNSSVTDNYFTGTIHAKTFVGANGATSMFIKSNAGAI